MAGGSDHQNESKSKFKVCSVEFVLQMNWRFELRFKLNGEPKRWNWLWRRIMHLSWNGFRRKNNITIRRLHLLVCNIEFRWLQNNRTELTIIVVAHVCWCCLILEWEQWVISRFLALYNSNIVVRMRLWLCFCLVLYVFSFLSSVKEENTTTVGLKSWKQWAHFMLNMKTFHRTKIVLALMTTSTYE